MLICFLSVLACLLTLAGFWGQAHWLLDLSSHFRLQYLLGLVLCSLLLTLKGRLHLALTLLPFVLINLALVLRCYLGLPELGEPGLPSLRVASLNLWISNQDYPAVTRFLEAEQPDVLLLMEFTHAWEAELESVLATYPYQLNAARGDYSGMGLYSRVPLLEAEVLPPVAGLTPWLKARLVWEGRPLLLLGSHPPAPRSAESSAQRNVQLAAMASYLVQQAEPVLVLGDLNITDWSPYFQVLLRQAKLRDSRWGRGLQTSWPAFLPAPLRIAIDHALVSPGVLVRQRRLGPRVGSDHLPVLLELVLPGAG